MKVTVILKDFAEAFYVGFGESIIGLDNMDNAAKFTYLNNLGHEGRVTMKIGNGSFRDRVDLNGMLRKPCAYSYKLEPRKGYKIATFNITSI